MEKSFLSLRLRKAAFLGAASKYWWSALRKDWILGRHACLGRDVLALAQPKARVFNLQKGRVDYLNALFAEPGIRARTPSITPYLENDQILPFILQQEHSGWLPAHAPVAVYMDSFADLADQAFTNNRDGWKFCSGWSDVSHGPAFEAAFRSDGLLALESLGEQYGRFFESLWRRYGRVPIFFLHFPSKLETREKFRVRKTAIEDALDGIKGAFAHFHSISVPEGSVNWPEEKVPGLENFPYHYDLKTYENFRRRLESIDGFRAVCGGT